jgi:hypothetical protein
MRLTFFFLLGVLILSFSAASVKADTLPCVFPSITIDNMDLKPQTADVLLVNERFHTHFWEYSISDESVLACVGTKVEKDAAVFSFAGQVSGECDVTFRYKRRNTKGEEPLITEIFRFYVDDTMGVTYEHIHFSTNER